MIYYLVSKKHACTVKEWIKYYPKQLKGRLRIIPYSKCRGTVPEGAFIFSDAERLSPSETQNASMLFSRGWLVKKPDCIDDVKIREEFEYFEQSPHEATIREIFDIAKIEFGRIDCRLLGGRIQTWEINANPMLSTPGRWGPSKNYLKRLAVHERGARAINEALLELDMGQESKQVRLRV